MRREGPSTQGETAAVFLYPDHPCLPTFVNCLFLGNGVGILADLPAQVPPVHVARIIHCTFAWNVCGIWNGQQSAPSDSRGESILSIVNCIFDATPPHPIRTFLCNQRTLSQLPLLLQTLEQNPVSDLDQRGFEGINGDDLTVLGAPIADYNAFEAGRVNLRTGIGTLALPATTPRGPVPYVTTPQLGLDVATYTRNPTTGDRLPRGVLWIRDLFFLDCHSNGSQAYGANAAAMDYRRFDLSAGDFRLAPVVVSAASVAGGGYVPSVNGSLHPFVDRGVAWPAGGTITMRNGQVLPEPGTIAGSGWPLTPYRYDGEGYGNPRLVDHPLYGQQGRPENIADLGCDELDVLVVTGQRFGTTSFYFPPSSNNLNPDAWHLRLWMLGPPRGMTSVVGPVPDADATRPWWRGEDVGTWILGSPYYVPSPVDVTPHLLPDVHPFWVTMSPNVVHPVWTECRPHNVVSADCPPPFVPDYPGPPVAPTYNNLLFDPPTEGIINPPGTHPVFVGAGFRWLENLTGAPQVWGPLGSAPPEVRAYGPWCENLVTSGATHSYDDLSPFAGFFARRTMEFFDDPNALYRLPFEALGVTQGNLQTFFLWMSMRMPSP